MPYSSRSTVVAFRNAKEASLYCEHVVPLELTEVIPVRDSGEVEMFEVLKKVLPPSLVDASAPRSVHPGLMNYIAGYLVAFPQALGITKLPAGETLESRARKQLPGLYAGMTAVLSSVAEPVNGVIGVDPLGDPAHASEDISCQLAGLKIVDVDRVSWKHLLAFREDKESVRKLQALRLFFHEKFDGKSKDYVHDSVMKAIQTHDETVKNWGFDTMTGVLESIFSSKSLGALGAAALTATLGGPIGAGAAVAAVFEVGVATIHIVSKRRSLSNFRRSDPVSYLIAARDLPHA
jgi:hypothetical protein